VSASSLTGGSGERETPPILDPISGHSPIPTPPGLTLAPVLMPPVTPLPTACGSGTSGGRGDGVVIDMGDPSGERVIGGEFIGPIVLYGEYIAMPMKAGAPKYGVVCGGGTENGGAEAVNEKNENPGAVGC